MFVLCVHLGLTHCLLFVFLSVHVCTHMCICIIPTTLYACVCMSLSLWVWMNMWICASDCVWVLLFRNICIVPLCGCCIHSALAGQCQQVPTLGGCGEGLQHPALGNGFLWSGQEGCSFSRFMPSPPSAHSLAALPTQVVSDHLPLILLLPGPNLPPPPHPSLPTPPSPTLPSEHPAWKASVPPLAPFWPGPNAVCFPLQVGAGAPCRQ